MERRESGGRQREQVGATVGAQGRLSGGQTGVWAGDTGELGPLSMHVGGGMLSTCCGGRFLGFQNEKLEGYCYSWCGDQPLGWKQSEGGWMETQKVHSAHTKFKFRSPHTDVK